MRISQSAQEWMATGERCRASETLFTYCTGVDALGDFGDAYPESLADLRRCRLLIEQCPELRSKMKRLGFISREWAELISFWDDLCTIHDLEAPDWRKRSTGARRTKKMLFNILARVGSEPQQQG